MKKILLIMIFVGANIVLFQNFTSLTEEEKANWGSDIVETDDDTYTDFRSALENSRKDHKQKRDAWKGDLEESDEDLNDQDVGMIRKAHQKRIEE